MRLWLALLALLALAMAPVHTPAAFAAPQPVAQASPPCHEAASAAPSHQAKPDKPACCPDGCPGDCSPVAAFFAAAPARLVGFLRAVIEAPVVAAVPDGAGHARERPPKIHG